MSKIRFNSNRPDNKGINNLWDIFISKKWYSINMDKKYRNRKWLYEQYVDKDRSITDIAKELDVDHTTISKWRRKLDIPKPNRKVKLECPVCGKKFERWESVVKNVKYVCVCSRECLYKARSQGIIKREVKDRYNTQHLKERYTVVCKNCGKKFEVIKSRLKANNKGKYCSRKCYEEAKSEMMKGENNWAYIDGRSYERMKFRGKEWRRIREKIIERDNQKCQKCGITRKEHLDKFNQDLHVHHKEPFRISKNNNLENLQTLCVECHSKIEDEVNNE